MTAHYPTSAELAAMRRGRPVARDERPGPTYGTMAYMTQSRFPSPTDGGAWPHEREHGIGWHVGDRQDRPGAPVSLYPMLARREANRLRRAAFDRMARYSVRKHDTAALIAAIETFAPVKVSANQRPDRPAVRSIADLDRESRPESESELRFAYGDR